MATLNQSRSHLTHDIGKVVFVARHFAGDGWASLTIPKGASANIKGEFKK